MSCQGANCRACVQRHGTWGRARAGSRSNAPGSKPSGSGSRAFLPLGTTSWRIRLSWGCSPWDSILSASSRTTYCTSPAGVNSQSWLRGCGMTVHIEAAGARSVRLNSSTPKSQPDVMEPVAPSTAGKAAFNLHISLGLCAAMRWIAICLQLTNTCTAAMAEQLHSLGVLAGLL